MPGAGTEFRIIEGQDDRYIYSQDAPIIEQSLKERSYVNWRFLADWQWQADAVRECNSFDSWDNVTVYSLLFPSITIALTKFKRYWDRGVHSSYTIFCTDFLKDSTFQMVFLVIG